MNFNPASYFFRTLRNVGKSLFSIANQNRYVMQTFISKKPNCIGKTDTAILLSTSLFATLSQMSL